MRGVRDIRRLNSLPTPDCLYGYTVQQIGQIFSPEVLPKFHEWMRGQTMSVCDGREYDHTDQKYIPTPCAVNPHGVVVYRSDVEAFLRGQEPLD